MKKLQTIFIATIVISGLMSLAGSSNAASRGELSISPSIGKVSQTYPGIPGVKPATPTTPFVQIRPPGCADNGPNSAYCDTIILNINKGKYEDLYYVEVKLEYAPQGSAGANRLDLNIWADEHPALGAPISRDWGAHQPKVARVGEPPTAKYWITVVNLGQPIDGYKLTVSFAETDLGPSFGRRRESSSPNPLPSPTRRAAAPAPQASGEEVIVVKTIGPDGQPTEFAIPIVKFKAASQDKDEDSGSPIVPLILSFLGAGLIAFLYFAVWRKRKRTA